MRRNRTLKRIHTNAAPSSERISVILPVLNEAARLETCLMGLTAQTEEVKEILVVDGGSTDGTRSMIERYQEKDPRVRLIDASPIEPFWTGKIWGLHCGLRHSDPSCQWILCVDADVCAAPLLVRSLLFHAKKTGVSNYSVAAQQRLSGKLDALIHPSMLTTLIYRFGAPGAATNKIFRVQANGQCFLSRRETLLRSKALETARASLCEDVTIARRLAECGETVGFYEADPGLIEVRMYRGWRETWNNWPRSLPMRDQYFGWRQAFGLFLLLPLQTLPLPVLVLGAIAAAPLWLLLLAASLTTIRIGVLIGVARAYPARPWTYWLSPLCDCAVVCRIIQFALRRRHTWRGQSYVRQPGGRFELVRQRNVSP